MEYSTTNTITSKLNRLFFLCGIFMTLSEIWKQWYLTYKLNNGLYQWWYFPFQLCSIAMYILLILPWIKKPGIRSTLLSFLMDYSLLGGIAVFADTSGLHYPVSILTAHSYLWHILLIIVGLAAGIAYIIESKSQGFVFRHFWGSTLLYLGCCLIASAINHIFDSYGPINMFYINTDYKMQQIGFSALTPYLGNGPTIILYILATIFGAAILFYIWRLILHCYQHFTRKAGT